MDIAVSYPPNIEDIKRQFDIEGKPVVFTYGNILHNPQNATISADLAVHEGVHTKQQGDNPESWWVKYLADRDFRLLQEVEAYRAQYEYVKATVKDKNYRARFLHVIASDLSGQIYGHMVSYGEAVRLIKQL